MPDISMCNNKECLISKSCYRFSCEPNPYGQTYSDFKPDSDGDCEFYIEMSKPHRENPPKKEKKNI